MLNLVRCWILLSTVLVGGGWILSALHELNRAGYAAILFPLALAAFFWWKKSWPRFGDSLRRWRYKFIRRFRRRPPQLFLLLVALSLLAGSLYPALNCDANAYRLPRVMHWLWAGQWHWIHTHDPRMNFAACGMEWLTAPLLLFTHTDRLLFLINWISYLMLPGLIFSVFTRLQVTPRVAWWWMWLLASGFCFVLQAGSAANDGFAAIYILAAVDLALRAREKNSATDLWLSLLAAALVTGVKQSNVPLAALWLIAAWPARSLFWKNPAQTAGMAASGLLVSIAPISLLNYHYYGTWLPLNAPGINMVGQFQVNPFWGIVGNVFCIPVQNLVPPFYSLLPPLFAYGPVLWNELMHHFLQTSLGAHFASFENFGQLSVVYFHGFTEGTVGLGFGICVAIFAAAREIRRLKKNKTLAPRTVARLPVLRWLRLAPWGLLLVFMAKVGTMENARHLAPYYPFLFPIWLAQAGHAQIIRFRNWQRLVAWIMALTALLLVTLSERPLFPAQTIFTAIHKKFPDSGFLSDDYMHYLESNFQVADRRRNYLRTTLPANEAVVGFYTTSLCEIETGLWLPFGRHRVESVLPTDPPESLRDLGIHFVIVTGASVPAGGITAWLDKYNGRVVGQYSFPRIASQPSETPDLYIVRLN